jgi:hypothetical protein
MGLYQSKEDYELKKRIDTLEKRLKELERKNKTKRKINTPSKPRKMSNVLQNDIKKAKLNTTKREKPILPIIYHNSLFLQLSSEIEKRRHVINVQSDAMNDTDILFNTMDSYI